MIQADIGRIFVRNYITSLIKKVTPHSSRLHIPAFLRELEGIIRTSCRAARSVYIETTSATIGD